CTQLTVVQIHRLCKNAIAVPRAQCFCFYGLDRGCCWSSDGVDDYEFDNFIVELPRELLFDENRDDERIKRTLTSGRTLLLLPVYASNDEPLGVLVSVFSKNDDKSSWFNPSLLSNILEPAVNVIAEIMQLNGQIASNDDLAANAEKELKLIYNIDEKIHGTSRSHSSLAQLIGKAVVFSEFCTAYCCFLRREFASAQHTLLGKASIGNR
ncbi:MAG: hypothetical protein ACKVJN_17990, partial [Woeseiales bacterium]